MVLHGNRLEDLRALVMDWLARNPLPPMEDEVLLVQSNGIAQWLKMAMAAYPGDDMHGDGWGVAFGIDVMLPGRFQWQAYRHVLESVEGPGSVPATSPFDKSRLRWRLMNLIPGREADPVFRPLMHFLGNDPDQRKRFQLAERLADLYDQYQVYRPHWLSAWAEGQDVILSPRGERQGLPVEQRWQARLWRDLLAVMPDDQRDANRAAIHQRFLEAARSLTPDALPPRLPRRVVVFGISALPQQVLHALSALSGAVQIMLCTVNPCRHYWGDIVEQRDLLRSEYRRQRRKPGMPVQLEDAALHLHAHPLLAAWGKQGRDYLHLLDAHDNPQTYEQRFRELQLRIDAFVPPAPDTLLGQLQNDIFELRPIAETRQSWEPVDPTREHSVEFHIAHSPQRELEVLHDQLLEAFRTTPDLRPRDVIVMVPDINGFAPYIHAVFGQFDREDPRSIPYQVSDQQLRHREPVLVALEQLLNLPRLRFRASEVLELLDVPAVRARFGLQEGDLPLIHRWVRGANVRWGLHAQQRASLGLPEHEELHSWRFGLQRMLMGYAIGSPAEDLADWEGIVPFDEITGLQAALIGPVYRLVEALDHHRQALQTPRRPLEWVEQFHTLMADFLEPGSPREEQVLGQLRDGLDAWLEECQEADFDQPLPLAIARESWLGRLDEARLSQRFLGGAVTFATLMPMRAIPFRQVCLLGMNDTDYPRKTTQMDFDLMARPGQYAPGDRSRREDDRYLFLEALLSARERLYVSWSGRSLQDNSERPHSVLVGQLRDHLAAGWRMAGVEEKKAGRALLRALTTEHPLQPFSEAYFTEPEAPLTTEDSTSVARRLTYAAEWEHLHRQPVQPEREPERVPLPLWVPEGDISLRQLAEFLRDPVEAFFRQRLNVYFRNEDPTGEDDEPFGFDGLGAWQQKDALLQPLGLQLALEPNRNPESLLTRAVEQRQRAGDFPPAPFGGLVSRDMADEIHATLTRYHEALQHYAQPVDPQPEIRLEAAVPVHDPETAARIQVNLGLTDSVEQLRQAPDGSRSRLVLVTSNLHQGKSYNWSVIVRHWPAHLATQVVFPRTPTRLFSPTDDLHIPGMDAEQARGQLIVLLQAWVEGLQQPLPTTAALGMEGLQLLDGAENDHLPDPGKLQPIFDTQRERSPGLARCFDTLEKLIATEAFLPTSRRLYGTLHTLLQTGEGQSR